MPMFDDDGGGVCFGRAAWDCLFVCGSEGVYTQGVARAHAAFFSSVFERALAMLAHAIRWR